MSRYSSLMHKHEDELNEITNLIPPVVKVHPDGRNLLAPVLSMVQAAHRGELPHLMVHPDDIDLNDYVCHVAAGIWYGETLKHPRLPAWMDYLSRLQDWWTSSSAQNVIGEKRHG